MRRRYQHSRELVKLLSRFAQSSRPLPPGWDTRFDWGSVVFYVDHNTQSTTYIDPRLPLDEPALDPNSLAALPTRRAGGAGSPTSPSNSALLASYRQLQRLFAEQVLPPLITRTRTRIDFLFSFLC